MKIGFSHAVTAIALLLAAPATAQSQDRKDVGNLAESPLEDVNIVKQKVSPSLEAIMANPYSQAGLTGCRQITAAVQTMDDALGLDFDAPSINGKSSTSSDLLMEGGQGLINSLIPGRFLIRMVSGADKAQKHAVAAVYAGSVRRGFLKGLGAARNCKPPAAPLTR